jgi:hypothetical protein
VNAVLKHAHEYPAHPVWAIIREFDHRSKHSQQDFFYFRRGKGEAVPKSSRTEPAQQRQPFNIHSLYSAETKIALAEIAGIISLVLLLIGGLVMEIKTLIHYLGS